MNTNQNLHSLTKLTEFARDFEEEPDTLFGRFVNKIQNAYNQSYNTVNDISSGSQHVAASKSVFYADSKAEAGLAHDSSSSSLNSATSSRPQAPNPSDGRAGSEPSTSTASEELSETSEKASEVSIEVNEGRTMVNVLKRISNIMASKNSDLRNYRDTDLQRFWMPDSKAKECYDCAQKFSAFRRKHHCRLCGQIFCSKCCNQVVPGKIIMCSGDLKVCNYCSKIVLSYLKSPNITVDLHSDLQALQQDLSSKLEERNNEQKSSAEPARSQLARKVSVGYQEERFASHQPQSLSMNDRKNILQQSNSLITLHAEMQQALPAQNCGLDLIEFLNTNHKSSNKAQALAILGAMLDAGFLQPIVHDSEQNEFEESLHYRFVELPRQALEDLSNKECAPVGGNGNPQFEHFSNQVQPPKSIETTLSFQSANDSQLENSMHSTASKLLESYCEHEEQLLLQMLHSYQLDVQWAKVLNPLCCRAANQFKPEYCTNELMDIRNYINFKKVPGGRRQDCAIVGGVVFSKNVAHKEMAARVEHPRILLLQCPIVYERIEGKFVSISTVLLQEREYLRNVCARIMSFKPKVVIVHKNVAGIAQDMLRSHGITLVLDVKLSVMERLSRTLQCDILTSIEGNIAEPKLGVCEAFYIRNYSDANGGSKTLMFFEKVTSARGYTCLLRGGSAAELAKVKKVASFLVYARYNWRLEMSFLLDEFAEALLPKPPLFESKETSPADEKADNIAPAEAEESLTPQLRSAMPSRQAAVDRRPDDRILTAVAQNVSDFTDPLRSIDSNMAPVSSNAFDEKLAVEMRHDNRFRNALSSTVLSVSPFLSFPLPYLETEQGRKCALRALFPTELYYSKLWSSPSNNNNNLERSNSAEVPLPSDQLELNPPHPFLKLKITAPIDNREIQTLLAEFRAFGGRYPKKPKMFKLMKRRKSAQQRPQRINEDNVFKDVLDLENHQRLPVLFCSFYNNPKGAVSFCAPPTLLDMKFYGQQDIMLGQFLQRYCCRLSSICARCNLPMLGHTRRYVHSMGCVKVFLSEDKSKTDPNHIYFTAWCSICNEVTPSVPLSEATKCLSLAKYLELRFHGHAYKKRVVNESSPGSGDEAAVSAKCQHSLHRDYVHYFSYRGVVAMFQYAPIEVWEISLPSLVLDLKLPKSFNRFEVLEEVKSFSMKGHEVYTRIHERIADLATEDENSPLVSSLKTTLGKDQFVFKQHIEIIQTLLTENQASSYDINDALLMAKRVLAENIELWGPRLHEIAVAQKLAAKQQQQHDVGQHVDAGTICTEDLRSESVDMSPTMPDTPRVPLPSANADSLSQAEDSTDATTDTSVSTHSMAEKKSAGDQFAPPSTASTSDKKTIKKMLIHLLPSTGPVNLLQSPFSAHEHYTLPLGAFPIIVHDQDVSSIIAYSLTSTDYQRSVVLLGSSSGTQHPTDTGPVASNSGPNATPSPHIKRKSQEGALDRSNEVDENAKETSSSKNPSNTTGSHGTANSEEERAKSKSNSSHIEMSFQDNNTQFTCKIYFAKEFDKMRAKTLKPPKLDKSLYREIELSKKREELKISQSRSGAEMELVRKPSDASLHQNSFSGGNGKSDGSGNKEENSPQQQSEVDECRYYLARSLCRSVQWEARGGKSGSKFCKTADDRFVLKEMSKSDISIFENFAPNYFDYISKCQQQNQPTLLAKIFGVFKVTIKKKDSFQEKSLLVMENLFYDCDIKNKFDLKGSERNRLVDPLHQQGEIVLLDENLVQMSWSKPLYILTHSKAVLKDAINRDASFLEKNQVMDYSLLVGLDERNSVLVLGIIDYIHTFTFDKKVESFVKQTGILGGMGKLPTVIPPEPYRQRFADAMDRYFNTVPDRWEGLSKI